MRSFIKAAQTHFLFAVSSLGKTHKWSGSLFQDAWPGNYKEGQQLYNGRFAYWGEEIEFNSHNFWRHQGLTQPFMGILHSFEWLRALRSLTFPEARGIARTYIKDWIHNNHGWHPIVWSPDIVGQRLSSWASLFDFFGSSADDDFLELFQTSFSRQLRYLDLICLFRPPHMLDIQVFKGLIISKIALGQPIFVTLRSLETYLSLNLYADGSHKNRSPMAQLMILRDLIDIRMCLKARGIVPSNKLSQALSQLADIVRFFRLGDGGLAVFQNSFEGSPSLIDLILSQSDFSKQTIEHLDEGGFFKINQGKTMLVFDIGSPLVQPKLMDDRLSFEFSYGDKRIITNGTKPFQVTSQMSQPIATTSLSSTVLFFDARNRIIQDLQAPSTIDSSLWTLVEDKQAVLSSEWSQKIGSNRLRHQRALTLINNGTEIRCEEHLRGAENGSALIRLNFHPSLKGSLNKDSSTIILCQDDGRKWRLNSGKGYELGLHRGYYYGIDNQELFCPQAVIKVRFKETQMVVKWTLRLLD
ncbi:MAG: heparinase II/III family protein [Alphaproteobacteria bacterium]|nr:heparinase II/III family protein [Alphaproteobacteria bacterium]OJV45786.1 MAG: hypothetical protein BGO28_06165 [Alphaproteobacteria bacterium 43-37]